MTVSTFENDVHLKNIFKEAFVEVLEERQDLFAGIVAEAIEDQGLIRAIQEGEQTPTVSREEVFRVLQGA
jgi:succinate dehydrogenase flavin-adding protein (antitoxin of CptAB toxin-antitoxin module)